MWERHRIVRPANHFQCTQSESTRPHALVTFKDVCTTYVGKNLRCKTTGMTRLHTSLYPLFVTEDQLYSSMDGE
jgi:hypothetical protein